MRQVRQEQPSPPQEVPEFQQGYWGCDCGCESNLWNTRVLDDDVRHVCDTCFDKGKTESCLVKAPAMRASESVLVVSELLCTGVQANTERHTKERNARNVLMLGIQTTLLLTQLERVA